MPLLKRKTAAGNEIRTMIGIMIETRASGSEEIGITIGTGITGTGSGTTASMVTIAITVSTAALRVVMVNTETRVAMATTVITSISKPNSKAIEMD